MTGHEPGGPARQRIGEIFVELGFITPDELDAALVVQGKTGALIGQILVDQGKISRIDLASALGEHWEARERVARESPIPHGGGVIVDDPPGTIEAMVGHIETVMANLGETLDRYEMDRTSERRAIGERLAAIENAILRVDEQSMQSSRVERYLNDKLDRLASQLEELLQDQPRSQAITAEEAAQPTEQGSNERHRSGNEETNSPDAKPSAAGKKHKHSKARKNHKR